MYEAKHVLRGAGPAVWWAGFYIAGPLGGVVLALTDTALVEFYEFYSPYIPSFETFVVASVLGVGVTAFVVAYGSGRVGARIGGGIGMGVAAATLGSLVAVLLDTLVEVVVTVYSISTPSPADEPGCGCGKPIILWVFMVIMALAISCLFRLGLSVTVGLFFAWLGVLLSRVPRGGVASVAAPRGMAVWEERNSGS